MNPAAATTSPLPRPPAPGREGIAISVVSQVGAKGVHLLLNIVSSVAIIRHLGPTGFGDFVVVTTVATLSGLVSDFGINKLAVREVARDETHEDEIIGSAIAARLLLATVSVAIAQLALAALGVRAELHIAAAILGAIYVTEAVLTIVIVFHVRLQQQYEAAVRVLIELLETVLVLVVIASGGTLLLLLGTQVVASIAGAVAGVMLAMGRARVRPRPTRHQLGRLLRLSLPVGPAMILGILYLRIDNLMIAGLRPRHEVGIYGSAFQPIEYLLLASAVLVNVRLPVLSRARREDREAFQDSYRRGTENLCAALLPVPVLLAFGAPAIVDHVYSSDYHDAAHPLRLLSVALLAMVLNAWQGFVLLAADHQRATLQYSAVALAASIAGNALLIPTLGYIGAAYATLAISTAVALWSTHLVAQLTGARLDRGRLARVAAASGGLAVIAGGSALVGLSPLAACMIAALFYPVLLHIGGAYRWRSTPVPTVIDLDALQQAIDAEATVTAPPPSETAR